MFKGKKISIKEVNEILEKEALVAELVNAAQPLISIVDGQAHFLKVNDRFAEVLGYSKEELVGMSYLGLVHKDDLRKTVVIWDRLMTRAVKDTGVDGFVNRYLCKDGKYAVLEWHANSKSIKGLALSFAIFKGYE
jgi:PAS domain S-box-containing protein